MHSSFNNDYIALSLQITKLLSAEPVILCIGSDRLCGDSLGPLTGYYLKRMFNVPAFVYGCLDMPVTALNLERITAHIKQNHFGSLIIAVDSSVGAVADIGKIRVRRGSLLPGSADGKKLAPVGDISVTAIVTNLAPALSIGAVRLGVVNSLAVTAAKSINHAVRTAVQKRIA